MTFTGIFSVFKDKLWSYHVMIPPKIAEELISNCTDKRVICKVGKEYSFQCAMLPDGNGGYFVMFNKARRKELNLNIGDAVEITLLPDLSEYGLPFPEELQELLYQDPEADSLFHKLTMGKQRSLIHIVGKYKNVETRLNKAIVIVNHLKNRSGILDFKILNEDFKNSKF